MTELTVKKLEEAFAFGCSDVQACLFAGISKQTLYNYQDANPGFVDRKAELKETPIMLARRAVVNGISGDPDLALKFLERKCKDEFSTKQLNENTENVKLENATLEELEAELERLKAEDEG